jgi:hypothetical protein
MDVVDFGRGHELGFSKITNSSLFVNNIHVLWDSRTKIFVAWFENVVQERSLICCE